MLSLEDVDFDYGRLRRRTVFRGLTWSVPPAKKILLLGPNGAGKSTLLSLLSGFRKPTKGHVTIDGARGRRALFDSVGWMPQQIEPVRGLTTLEQVAYSAWLSGRSKSQSLATARALLDQVMLQDKADERSSSLSGGQLRRLGLAQALTREGQVLLLDEPTAGLDPAQSRNFRSLVRTLPEHLTVVVSTHQVEDLDDDFDHVVVVARGTVRFDDSVEAFRTYGHELGVSSNDVAEIFSVITEGGLH